MTHATNADDHTSHADNKEKNNRSFTILFFDFSLRDQSIDRSKLASMYTFKRTQKFFFQKKKEQLLNCSMIKKRRRQNMCIICIYMYIRRRKRMQARIEGKNKKLLLASPNSNIRAREKKKREQTETRSRRICAQKNTSGKKRGHVTMHSRMK